MCLKPLHHLNIVEGRLASFTDYKTNTYLPYFKMSSRKRTCCVPNCNDKFAKRFSLRTNKEIRDIWLERIGNQQLLQIDDKKILNYVICANHFDPMCFDLGGKLLKFALPTINLSGFTEASTRENCFMKRKSRTPSPVSPEISKEACASTSATSFITGESPVYPVKRPRKVYSKKTRLFTELTTQDDATSSELLGSAIIPIQDDATSQKLSSSGVEQGSSYGIDQTSSDLLGSAIIPESSSYTPSFPRSINLKKIGVTREKYLSPEGKLLYKEIKNLKRRLYRRNTSSTRCKMLNTKRSFLQQIKSVNEFTRNFILSQMKNQKLKARGRRFTLDDKILALSIYKQSRKGYRFLSKIFCLPSRRVLLKLLQKIPLYCGINDHVFNHLKSCIGKLKSLDRNCVLMFDEVSLQPGLQYNFNLNCIEGFEDLGNGNRRVKFADHALVFLLKGIHKKWKQPVCFTFCEHSTASADLVVLIKSVIRHVHKIGLRIIATISDQGATNVCAIKNLISDTSSYCVREKMTNKFQGYLVDGVEVVHLFDVPHLLKGLRNGLLRGDLKFSQDGVSKVASWDHLVQLYNLDKKMGRFSMIHKLTDEHVLADRIKKMKVKNCTQVFSRTVATAMMAKAITSKDLDPSSDHYLNPQASDTADLFLFLDELFDSLNGSQIIVPFGKELRSVVTQKSKHVSFWTSALPVLKSMVFISHSDKTCSVIPSIKNFIFTICGFLYIWNILKVKGFKFMAPRGFNQDPVENFFSCIRSYSVRNINPNCSSFISSTKALLINGFVSSHSVGSNCEEDESVGVLDTLKSFVETKTKSNFIYPQVEEPIYATSEISTYNHPNDFATAYVAGIVVRKMLCIINCNNCREKMEALDENYANILITTREYRKEHHLMHPSSSFYKTFRHIANVIYYILPKVITFYDIKRQILSRLELEEDIGHIFCREHQCYSKNMYEICINIVLFDYISKINRVLNGTDLRHKDDDQLTRLAFIKYSKKRKR